MATVTWIGGGINNNASTGLNWDNATGPATGDKVSFDGAFPLTGNDNCNWDIATVVNICEMIGYAGIITLANDFNNTGDATLTSGTFVGSGFNMTVSTFVSNISFSGITTLTTLASVNVSGSFTAPTNLIVGSGSLTSSGISFVNVTMNGGAFLPGNLTASGNFATDGSFNPNGFLVTLNGTTTISGGPTFSDLVITGTATLSAPVTVTSSLSGPGVVNGSRIYIQGSFTNGTGFSGTTIFEFLGSNICNYLNSANVMSNPVVINKNGSSVQLQDSTWVLSGDFTYTAGNLQGNNTQAVFSGTSNLSSNGFDWGSNFFTGLQISGNVTLVGDLYYTGVTMIVTGNFNAGTGNTIFSNGGTLDLSVGTYTQGTSTFKANGNTTIINWVDVNMYNLTVDPGVILTLYDSVFHIALVKRIIVTHLFTANNCTILSDNPGGFAYLRVTGSQNVSNVSATDIDSSGAKTVHNVGGANTNTVNWDTSLGSTGNFFLVM